MTGWACRQDKRSKECEQNFGDETSGRRRRRLEKRRIKMGLREPGLEVDGTSGSTIRVLVPK
jgi:hypothetical protein